MSSGQHYAHLSQLPTPTLVLDLDVLERNLVRMSQRAEDLGVVLRPHFKTHKSPDIARMQLDLGCRGLTVSTLAEARLLLAHDVTDITWAFPLILNRVPELIEVMRQWPAACLRLVVDSLDAVTSLEAELAPEVGQVHAWLKVDCGYHRAGVDPHSELAYEVAQRLHRSDVVHFDGLLSHSGHSYYTPGVEHLQAVAEEERSVMVEMAERLRRAGIEVPGISIGSTPAMSRVRDLTGVTEARPGNYAFYDFSQCALGSCEVDDCAVTVLASVVSSQPTAEHCVIDAGALSLSKDPGMPWTEPPTYGEIFSDYEAGELNPQIRVISLSQEHGIINAPLPVGTRLRVLPNHSCLVAPCFDRYVAVRGERILGELPIMRSHPGVSSR